MADEGDIAGEGALARILARWCDLCRYPTRQAYLDWLRELYNCESEAEVLESLEPFESDVVQGEGVACLRTLADTNVAGHAFSPWLTRHVGVRSRQLRGLERLWLRECHPC